VSAVAAPDRAAADHPGGWGDGGAGHRGRDRRGDEPGPERSASGPLGGVGAGDARVGWTTDSGREAARQQMADRDVGRGRRLRRPDAWQELSGRPTRPGTATARDWPSAGPRAAPTCDV